MSDKYLDGSQLNSLQSKPDLNANEGLKHSAYVSVQELQKSPYDTETLPKNDVKSPRDEVPNCYTNMNTDLELLGYYFANHEGETHQRPTKVQGKLENSDIETYQATNVPPQNTSNSNSVNGSSNSIKPYESANVGYEYNSSSSEISGYSQPPSQQASSYDEEMQDAVQGYGGYELDALARVVLQKPEKEKGNAVQEMQGDNEDLEVLNSITAFEEIINSEGTLSWGEINGTNALIGDIDTKNISNESQEHIANINLFYNTEFRRLMSLPDSVRKFEQLGQLANDFVYNAGAY